MAAWARDAERTFDDGAGATRLPAKAPAEGSRSPGLAGGLETFLRDVEARSARQSFPRQQVLFSEGEKLAHLYLVEKGSFKLVRHSEEGKELIVNLAGPGDFFGALAEPSEASVLAQALEDSVVLAIPVIAIRQSMDGNVELGLSLLRRAERRLDLAETQAARLAFESVPQRLAHLLLEATDRRSGRLRFPLNQSELAQLIGSSRETVCSLLNQFRREGLISTSAGKIRVVERGRLESVE